MSLGVLVTPEEKRQHFKINHFMMEAGVKLRMKSVPMATASRIYHKFFTHNHSKDFDPYLVAATSLYLAGKVEEENIRLRDVINVAYRSMYKEKPPLDIGSTYWALREAITHCELLVLRALKFHVSFIHPHKYLLHYIKSLYDWLHPAIVKKFPIARTAWAILRDSYHGTVSLHYDPEHIAIAALYLALQSFGIEVPTSQDAEYQWWEALVEDLRIERIRRICRQIMEVYEMETQLPEEGAPEDDTDKTTKAIDMDDIQIEDEESKSQTPKEEIKPSPLRPKPKEMIEEDDIDAFLYSDESKPEAVTAPQADKQASTEKKQADFDAILFDVKTNANPKLPEGLAYQSTDLDMFLYDNNKKVEEASLKRPLESSGSKAQSHPYAYSGTGDAEQALKRQKLYSNEQNKEESKKKGTWEQSFTSGQRDSSMSFLYLESKSQKSESSKSQEKADKISKPPTNKVSSEINPHKPPTTKKESDELDDLDLFMFPKTVDNNPKEEVESQKSEASQKPALKPKVPFFPKEKPKPQASGLTRYM